MARLPQFLGHAVDGLPFGGQHGLRVGEAGEGAGLLGQRLRVEAAARQELLVPGGSQLPQTLVAEPGAVGGQRVGVEEGPNLPAERLVLAAGESDLTAVPEGIAGQGDFQGLPGAFVGVFQGVGEFLAVVGEPLGKEADDGLADPLDADGRTGAIDQLARRSRKG